MSPHSSKAMTRHAWFIFSILTICYALVSFFRTSTSTLAVDIMREFAVGGGLMSVMSSAYFYPYGFMQIPAGILSDRWGSRNTIASFLLIGAAGSFLFALSGSVTAATAGRVLIGVGMGMVFVPALRVILYWFPPARHALGTGLILSLGTGGMLLATYPLMLLSQAVGWRGSMFAATAATVLVAGATWLWVRNRPEEAGYAPAWVSIAPRKHPAPPLRETMLRIVRSRTYWSVSTWFFCMYGSFYAMTGLWAGPYFIQGYGLDKGTAGGILFCMALGAVVGPSLVGVVVTWVRWSKGVLLLAASGVTILLAAPLLADHPVLPASLLPVWSLAFGIFCGGFGGIALTKVQEDFPPRNRGHGHRDDQHLLLYRDGPASARQRVDHGSAGPRSGGLRHRTIRLHVHPVHGHVRDRLFRNPARPRQEPGQCDGCLFPNGRRRNQERLSFQPPWTAPEGGPPLM